MQKVRFRCLEDYLDFPLGFVTEIILGALDSFGVLIYILVIS